MSHVLGVKCTRGMKYLVKDFLGTQLFSSGLLSRSRLRGTQEARVYTTAQMRALAEVGGECSGPSKSRILANNYGESFRPARAKQDNVNSTILKIFVLFCWL